MSVTRTNVCCDSCRASLIEIDHWGERLTGCIECNTWQGGTSAFVIDLSVEEIQALRELRTNGRQARPV
jgi:hypothetical protein